ncbi:pyridoxamine 5'-phosphate oxidase family protein [Haloarcula marina]|uniref:pyridoxamine 5'-phosphate oxidase family protein n=1 Tax=Haloarcula marina TaxID=2961574 RepID=UPI0020B6996A|nr:pyridoxamine 5'-phosphate oxidase family protein [Halomicroarcula marina]
MTLDELREFGLTRMDDGEMRDFLRNQRTGVVGIPTEGAPYLLPMSFGYDGDKRLYFTFVGGPESRKRELVEQTDTVRFLTYAAQSMFNWESLVLTGRVRRVPEAEWDDIADVLGTAWRPEVFQAAVDTGEIAVYEFTVRDWTGIKHAGLPPGFDTEVQ